MFALALFVAALGAFQDAPRRAPLEPPEEAEQSEQSESQPRLFRQMAWLMRIARELGDWETHHAYAMSAMERIFERNGWDSEADEFAREVVREVDAIPPWAPQERLDRFMELFSDRYALDEPQERHFREVLLEESSRLFARQSGRIMQYAPEVIRTRAAQEPITAEQVARWATLMMPVLEDAARTNRRVVERLLPELDPTQQEMLRGDVEAHARRLDVLQQMARSWQQGEWRPEDWGLEEDPIQTGAVASDQAPQADQADPTARTPGERQAAAVDEGESPAARDRSTNRLPAGGVPVPSPAGGVAGGGRHTGRDDHPWADYVRQFIRKYSLDADQERSAWRIYDSVTEQRRQLERRTGVRTAQAPPLTTQPATGPAAGFEPVTAHERLFEQLRRRLERLPTRAQRAAAESVGE
jgi:hypothetical protein